MSELTAPTASVDIDGAGMEVVRHDLGRPVTLGTRDLLNNWLPRNKVRDVEVDDTDSVIVVLRPVFAIGRLLGFPFQVKFRWLSMRTLWLASLMFSSTALTVLTINDNLRRLQVASVGAIAFYLLATTYLFNFVWISWTWPKLREDWLALEKRMKGMPKVRINTAVAIVAASYIIIGICEHSFSILDNLRQVVKSNCTKPGMGNLELYYRVHYAMVFQYMDYAVWKGAFTSLVILTITVAWTFTDVFTITIAMALTARFRQLKIALQEVKGKEMPQEFWKEAREIYLDLSFVTKNLDDKISLLIFLSLGNNVYTVILMLLNALSLKTNKDFLQTAYYMLSFTFVLMRLAGVCVAASKINEHSKSILPLLASVPSGSYCMEVHRFAMHAWYDPIVLTAFKFFAITRSTILKIAGSIVTYEIVLVQFNLLDTDEKVRRPKADCPAI